MKTTPMSSYGRTAEESFAAGARIHLETVDCELCEAVFVPHLLDLPNGEMIGLCTAHLADYPRLWTEAVNAL